MPYIIPITLLSFVVLFLTTIKSNTVGTKKSGKAVIKRKIDKDAFTDIVRQVVIVFLSAMLAMWLTEFVEQKTVKNRVQDLVPHLQVSISSQFAQVGGEITDIHKGQSTNEEDPQEQLRAIVNEIERDDMALWEAMLYNEDFQSTLDPMSYMHLNMDISQMRHIKENLHMMDISAANKQVVATQIAEYLYYCTDAAFCLEFLCEDVDFELLLLATLDDIHFDSNVYYKMYHTYLENLEECFGVDLSEWKGKRQFSKTTLDAVE